MPSLPFTLRRLQPGAWIRPLAVWVLAALAAALTGPFGTFEALEPGGRLLYWGGVVGAAVLLHLGFHRGVRGLESYQGRELGIAAGFGLDLGYALLLGAGIWALNRALFSGWESPWRYAWLVLIILAVSFAITALRWILDRGRTVAPGDGDARAPSPAAEARFLRRLPVEKRAPLLRIEAQDHYLLVVTRAGSELLLMRMADAEAELPAALGMRVHRSHWVALAGVTGRSRREGRVVLHIADGSEVPVSRGYRSAARGAGLF